MTAPGAQEDPGDPQPLVKVERQDLGAAWRRCPRCGAELTGGGQGNRRRAKRWAR